MSAHLSRHTNITILLLPYVRPRFRKLMVATMRWWHCTVREYGTCSSHTARRTSPRILVAVSLLGYTARELDAAITTTYSNMFIGFHSQQFTSPLFTVLYVSWRAHPGFWCRNHLLHCFTCCLDTCPFHLLPLRPSIYSGCNGGPN